jgi:preprotein translocase subunit SecG
MGGGGGGGFMSSRGTANLLTRTTAILAAGFFITSLFLSWLAGYDRKPSSIHQLDQPRAAVAAGERADQRRKRRPARYAEEAGQQQHPPAPIGSAGAAVAIKQGAMQRRLCV